MSHRSQIRPSLPHGIAAALSIFFVFAAAGCSAAPQSPAATAPGPPPTEETVSSGESADLPTCATIFPEGAGVPDVQLSSDPRFADTPFTPNALWPLEYGTERQGAGIYAAAQVSLTCLTGFLPDGSTTSVLLAEVTEDQRRALEHELATRGEAPIHDAGLGPDASAFRASISRNGVDLQRTSIFTGDLWVTSASTDDPEPFALRVLEAAQDRAPWGSSD